MQKKRWALELPAILVDPKLATWFSSFILTFAGVYLAISLLVMAAWQLTRNDSWIEFFFQVPGAFALVLLASVECLISAFVAGQFSQDHGLHQAWRLIAISAGCNLASAMCIQFLSTDLALNPLRNFGWWSHSTANMIRLAGFALGGPFRFALLSGGLAWVLRVYRKSGFLSRLKAMDWIVLTFVGLYAVVEMGGVAVAIHRGKHPSAIEVLCWPTDTLLWLLLSQGLLLYRSVQEMGHGWIGRCWQSLSIGVFLVTLADFCEWGMSWGYIPWPWNSLQWCIWIPAAGAFALAPLYQWEAILQARAAGRDA